jgi:modulator of FtsH protease HflC
MTRRLLAVIAALLVIGGIVAMSSVFIVDLTEQALVLRFGDVRQSIDQPGVYLKWPFEDKVYYEKRLLDFEPPPEEIIAADQKRLVVDTYTRYRIVDSLLFYQTVNSEAAVRGRLGALVGGSLRRVIGNVTLADLLSAQRATIMGKIRDEVREEAKPFGIDVVDVRIRRADLPPENSEAIYKRMISERQQQAAQYRGEGAQAAQEVRAKAERERTVILAEAQRKAQEIRGDGDAQATKIFAKAFGQDEQFYAFYRSLEVYRNALNGHDTSFVLNPEGNLFRFFGGWQGVAGAPAPASGPSPGARGR